jgi:integrase
VVHDVHPPDVDPLSHSTPHTNIPASPSHHAASFRPLHPTTVTALQDYRQFRDQHFPAPRSPALLVSTAGTRLLYYNVGQTFARLARRAGLASRSGNCRPRPHDLRHSFAVATLLDWCHDGGNVAARMPLLSAYLGHAAPAHTYWYLHASPEVLAEAARRLPAVTREQQ